MKIKRYKTLVLVGKLTPHGIKQSRFIDFLENLSQHKLIVNLTEENYSLQKYLARHNIEYRVCNLLNESNDIQQEVANLEYVKDLIEMSGAQFIITYSPEIRTGFKLANVLNIRHVWNIDGKLSSKINDEILKPYSQSYINNVFITPNYSTYIHLKKNLKHKNVRYYNNQEVFRINHNIQISSKVDIIIPFYNDKNIFGCIDSILNSDTSKINNIVVVMDAGPDKELNEEVKVYAKQHPLVRIIENEENKGFVTTCNVGMKSTENDVILLNSDTEVFGSWVEDMLYVAYTSKNTMTVTPFSNSASPLSFPDMRTNEYDDENPSETSELFNKLGEGIFSYIYSGHGFCFFIKRKAIRELGILDEKAFGLGYGEENDYSMRINYAKYKNAISYSTYVLHKRGKSFSDEKKKALKETNKMKLLLRYPEINTLAAEFINEYVFEDYFELLKQIKKVKENIGNLTLVLTSTQLDAKDLELDSSEMYFIEPNDTYTDGNNIYKIPYINNLEFLGNTPALFKTIMVSWDDPRITYLKNKSINYKIYGPKNFVDENVSIKLESILKKGFVSAQGYTSLMNKRVGFSRFNKAALKLTLTSIIKRMEKSRYTLLMLKAYRKIKRKIKSII